MRTTIVEYWVIFINKLKQEIAHMRSTLQQKDQEVPFMALSKFWKFREWNLKIKLIVSHLRSFFKKDVYKHDLYLEKLKLQGKKIILYFDWQVPTFDKDAGSFIAFQYLTILKDLEYKIIFWPHDLLKTEPYTEILQKMGIDVIYGKQSFEDFLVKNGKFIDVAVLSRPDISHLNMYFVKKYTIAKILYMAHDLHFLRELRSLRFSNDENNIKNIYVRKKRELSMIENADISLFFSDKEVEIVNRIRPGVKAKVIPWVQEACVNNVELNPERREILFLGGFNHLPNVDAIKWFYYHIFPLVKKSVPDAQFTIMGSNPTDDILKMKSVDCTIIGHVEETDLHKIFQKARVFVAPLRYGAGFKGKIAKAIGFGLPVVTTKIGSEGVGLKDGKTAMIADDPNEFSSKIVKLYKDDLLWENIASNGLKYLKHSFSFENAEEKIRKILMEVYE